MGRRSGLLAGLLLTSMSLCAPTRAQTSGADRGAVQGTVRTEGGQPLPAVVVRIPSMGSHTLTDEQGRYSISGLPPGTLTVQFERIGYGAVVREVSAVAGELARLDVTLTVRAVSLEELVVTGTPGVRDPLAASAKVDAVGAEALRRVRDASLGTTLARAVQGISSIETGSQAGIPVLRGLSGTRVRVLQNGVGQEFYQYGVRHHPTTSLVEAERVEVVRGSASILYGSDALGGAINVLTKRLPVSPREGTHVGGYAELQAFSNNGEAAGLLDLHAAWGGIGVRAGLEVRDAGDVRTPNEPDFFEKSASGTAHTGVYGDPKYTGKLPFTGFHQWSGYAQAGLRRTFGEVEGFLNHWDNENNFLLPSGGPIGNRENPPLGVGLHLAQTSVTLKGTLALGQAVLKPIVGYQRAVRQALPAGSVVGDDTEWAVDLRKDVLTSRVELSHQGRIRGTVGAELAHHDGETRGPVALEPAAGVTNVGVFAFEETRLHSVTLSVGARLDHRRQEAEANTLTSDPRDLTSTYTVLSGSVGAVVRVGKGWAVAANATSGFRAPTVFELFADGEHGGVAAYQRGNPGLEPERSWGGDLSLRVRRDRLRGEVSGYWTLIRDYIYLANTGGETDTGLPIYQAEQTDASLHGVEGTVEMDVTPWLTVGAHGSAVDGTGDDVRGADDAAKGPLPLLPPVDMGAFIRLSRARHGPLLSPAVQVDVHHAMAKDAAGVIEPFAQFDLIPFGTASTEAYTLVGLEASGVLEIGVVPLSATLTVTNLMDTAYRAFLDTYKGYALSMGRRVGLRLSAPLSLRR